MEKLIQNRRWATFAKKESPDFYRAIIRRVNTYFTEKGRSKRADSKMIAKMVFCFSLFFSLYAAILFLPVSPWLMLLLGLAFGVSSALLGFNIGHDATHRALFKSEKLNWFFRHSFELIGMSSYAWYLKHNVVHHNFPNSPEVDFDIEAGPILRFSPTDPLLPHHRYQHLYAPIAYMLLSLSLIFFNDFKVVFATQREFIDGKPHPRSEKIKLIISKLLYLFFMLVLPFLVLDLAWWQLLTGFLVMHFTLSILLALVLIPAHVFEHTAYPKRENGGFINRHWSINQMETTQDYAANSQLANFFFGGLNINVGHHLFPMICHIHLIEVSNMVAQTAKEFGVPYHRTSLKGAIGSHFRTLKELGRNVEYSPGINN